MTERNEAKQELNFQELQLVFFPPAAFDRFPNDLWVNKHIQCFFKKVKFLWREYICPAYTVEPCQWGKVK